LAIVAPLLLGIDVGARHWRVANARDDADDPPLKGEWPADSDPDGALDRISETIKAEFPPSEPVQGILVGAPYPLRDDKTIRGIGAWSNYQLHNEFRRRLGHGFLFDSDSDVNLGALAELDAVRGDSQKPLSLLYLKWSSNLRAATVIDGRVYNADGFADAYLHETVTEDIASRRTRPCLTCGRVCTASYASLTAVLDDIGDIAGADTELRMQTLLAQVAANPEGDAAERLRRAATLVGRALGRAANAIIPDYIVLASKRR
jgi:predicted NBD/HSP70 family sugar kinase